MKKIRILVFALLAALTLILPIAACSHPSTEPNPEQPSDLKKFEGLSFSSLTAVYNGEEKKSNFQGCFRKALWQNIQTIPQPMRENMPRP